MGVQSTTMYLMSSTGLLERADYAVFSDPGAEHPDTYKMLDWLLNWKENNNGIDIIVNDELSLLKDILNGKNSLGEKFVTIPAWVDNGLGNKPTIAKRQCTGEYKIKPVIKSVRKLQGVKKHCTMKKFEMWLGISIDEASRMKESPRTRIKNRFPLIEKMMTRMDCIDYLESNNYPIPIKSSCVFCPFQSPGYWRDIKKNYPEHWNIIKDVDSKIRDVDKNKKMYLHRNLKPIDELELEEDQLDLFDNECEGHCGF